MKRIKLMVLMLVAACALGGASASSAMAANDCYPVADQTGGKWQKPNCTEESANGRYNRIIVPQGGLPSKNGIACVRVATNNTGAWTNAQCTEKVEGQEKNWVRVYERPSWSVGGAQLKQGAKQIKLQLKGTAVLKSEITLIPVTIECKNSVSEGATIEGEGANQGQDKGRITFTQCKIGTPPKCKVEEPITTVQTKSHLATVSGQQTKIVDLFEPQQGETFATIKIINGAEPCAVAGAFPVNGNVAAELIPNEVEGQEGLLNFPEKPITTIVHEEEEKKIGLFLGVVPAKFSAAYGARLETNEPYGVFGG